MRTTLNYGLFFLLERVTSFFMLPLLTRSLTEGDYVIWTQSVIVTGVLTPIVLLGFQTAIIKYLPIWGYGSDISNSCLLAIHLAVFGFAALVASVFLCLPGAMTGLVYGQVSHPLVIAFCFGGLLVGEMLFELLVAILRASGQMTACAQYLLIKGLLRIGAFLVALHVFHGSFIQSFVAVVAMNLLLSIALYVRHLPVIHIARTGIVRSRPYWHEVFSFSLPLVVLSFLIGANNSVDRFFMVHASDPRQVASYMATYSITSVSIIFYSTLGFTLFPALAQFWAVQDRTGASEVLSKTVKIYLALIVPFIAGIATAGQEIYALLTPKSYSISTPVMLLLGCSTGLFGIYQIFYYILLLAQGSLTSLPIIVVSVLTNVALNAFLVPAYGAVGAAASVFTSNLVLSTLTLIMARSALRLHLSWEALLRIIFYAGLMALVILLAKAFIPDHGTLGLFVILFFSGCAYLAVGFADKSIGLRCLLH